MFIVLLIGVVFLYNAAHQCDMHHIMLRHA